jgi:AraC family transcriptional regulator, transcriptional activator of pobA
MRKHALVSRRDRGVGLPASDLIREKEGAVATALERIPSFFLYGEAQRGDEEEPTVHVEPIEFRSAPHHWKIDPHVHRTLYQLIFAVRGRGVSFAEGAMTAYAPPALIIVPAGTVHGFEFEPGTEGFVLSMTDDILREISCRDAGIATLFEKPATRELSNQALRATDLTASFKMLVRELGRALPGHALAVDGLLKMILANVLRLSQPSIELVDAAAGRYRGIVIQFRELIETAFREGWSLAEYASALAVSQSRLRNACLSVTEQSPMQMVHSRILLEAKRQLRYSSASVGEIAYALGFDDPAYFTRFFSQRTGVSPRAFRSSAARLKSIDDGGAPAAGAGSHIKPN